ncbi:MAG: FAD binding domain-containing protein [Nitrospinota bacterium]
MRGFEFVAPRTVERVLEAIRPRGLNYKLIAGGTNVCPDLRHRTYWPDLVVDLMRVKALRYVRETKAAIKMGALTTCTDLLENKLIRRYAPVLCAMAEKFAGPPIRNRATVAGNIVDASPAADIAPPLLALKARVKVRSARGGRVIPMEEFFLDYRKVALQPGELIAEVEFPKVRNMRWGYYKLGRRNAMAISVVSAAVVLGMNGKSCREAGISLGAVAPIPLRVRRAEGVLEGERVERAQAQKAGEEAAAASRPIDDIRGSAEYRRLMCEVLTRRLICQALQIPLEVA